MQTIKIFLASSSELKTEREQFEIFLSRKNKDWVPKGLYLELVIWEDFLDAMSPTRLQEEYNKVIATCNIFVVLFFTKVGKYTAEEFEHAFHRFKETNKPFIFTYFKDAEITTGQANKQDLISLWAFQEKLSNLGHFYTVFKNIDELNFKFNNQLDRLATLKFMKNPGDEAVGTAQLPAIQIMNSKNAVTGSQIITGGDFIVGDNFSK